MSVLCRAPARAQDCQKRGDPALTTFCITKSIQDGISFENYDVLLAEETEGSRSCNDDSGKSARLSLRASDTSSSSELEHPKEHPARRSEAHVTWHRWIWNCSRILSVPRHAPPQKQAHEILHEPQTENPFPMHPYRCRHQAIEDSNYRGEDREFSQMLFVPNAQLTMTILKRSRTPAQL